MAMRTGEISHVGRDDRPMTAFLWEHRREVLGPAFWLGAALGTGVGFGAAYSKHTLDNAIAVLTTEVLLGVALLATVLAALAILATLFDEHYREALRELRGDFLSAVLPFRVVAFSGAVAASAGLVSITLWGVFSHTLKSIGFGLVAGATVCAVIGTWELVRDQTFHGLKRDQLLERHQTRSSAD
jgi:hypothetical protein